jgi:hypothetical protein
VEVGEGRPAEAPQGRPTEAEAGEVSPQGRAVGGADRGVAPCWGGRRGATGGGTSRSGPVMAPRGVTG